MRIGTRASVLALAQARRVAERLGPGVEIVPMRTEGDRRPEARLAALGGKGLFVREIEEALLGGAIDVAVHSLKDLPAELPAGLHLAAFPVRDDPRDVLVARQAGGLAALRAGSVVGTSSPRRRAIVLGLRPDLVVEPIRGNVDRRLRKLEAGGWDALIVAAAGLERLGLTPPHREFFSPEVFVPAVGQGIVGLEIRADDAGTAERLAALDDPVTRACAVAERGCLRHLGASCATAVAAHGRLDQGVLRLVGLVASEDGRRVLRETTSGAPADADEIGRRLAELLLERGAASVAALDPPVTVRGAGA